mgnify:CR=1 FL=1
MAGKEVSWLYEQSNLTKVLGNAGNCVKAVSLTTSQFTVCGNWGKALKLLCEQTNSVRVRGKAGIVVKEFPYNTIELSNGGNEGMLDKLWHSQISKEVKPVMYCNPSKFCKEEFEVMYKLLSSIRFGQFVIKESCAVKQVG